MKHFDISEWTDFARGVAADPDRAAMDAHMVSGCLRCRATLDLVKRVVASTRADAVGRYDPPVDAVRWAKALSALQRPQSSPLSRLVARLVYDSRLEPLAVGLRAEDRVSRHTLFEAGDFYLDLRLEQEKGSPLVTLVGQLTSRKDPEGALVEAPVLLMARKDIVAHAVYNRFGEFQMDYPPVRDLRLCVALDPAGKRFELALGRLMTETPKPKQPGKAVPRPLSGKPARSDRKKVTKSPRKV